MDRWAIIREHAAKALAEFERRAGYSAFTDTAGSYALLPEMGRVLYRLTVFPDDELPDNLSGWLSMDEMILSYNPREDVPRQHFTIAHDIGHCALGHPLREFKEAPDSYNDMPLAENLTVRDGIYRAYSAYDRMELEANVFAAEFLAPLDRVQAAVYADPGWTVDGLARYFGITHTAMYNQLAALYSVQASVSHGNSFAPKAGRASGEFEDGESAENWLGAQGATLGNRGSRAQVSGSAIEVSLTAGEPVKEAAAITAPATSDQSESITPGTGTGSEPTLDTSLNNDQDRAVHVTAPALIVAGPGTGKTLVLARRFATLLANGAEARKILAITFGNKAAEEMRSRIAELVPEHAHELQVTTFHALGLELLRGFSKYANHDSHGEDKHPTHEVREPKLLTDIDAFIFLRSRLGNLPMGYYEDAVKPTDNLGPFLKAVSRAKDEMVDPAGFAELVAAWRRDIDSRRHGSPQTEEERKEWEEEEAICARCADISDAYSTYHKWLRAEGYYDYGDLILEAVRLFDDEHVAEAIRQQYDHILVDEFQDVNYASGRLVKALDGGRGIVWCVGDPWQSIYQFRGASPANLNGFCTDYPGAEVLFLKTNYRSVEDIVMAGQALRRAEVSRVGEGSDTNAQHECEHLKVPDLQSYLGRLTEEPAVELLRRASEQAEMEAIVQRIEELHAEGIALGQMAILCRKNIYAEAFSSLLEVHGIPTDWGGELQERAIFKDLVGVLLLACDNPQGLLRLARMPEHLLSEADLRLLLATAGERGGSAQAALYAACDGEIKDFSAQGRAQAVQLKRLAGILGAAPTPWHALAHYLFELAEWPRTLLLDSSPAGRRRRATVGQVASLVREFSERADIAGGQDTKALLEFLHSSLEAGNIEATDAPLTSDDAVHVLTAHRSKSLEWQVVFVPFLVEGRFPLDEKHRRPSLPLPPGLIHAEESLSDSTAEMYLFYVAITRARHKLVLSYSTKYGRDELPCSTSLSAVIESLSPAGFLREINLPAETVLEPVGELSQVEESLGASAERQVTWSEEEEHKSPEAASVADVNGSWTFPGDITFNALKTYEKCPQRFKYEYVYNLRNSDRGYLAFRTAVTDVMAWAAEQATSGVIPNTSDALEVLAGLWHETGLVDHWYGATYRQQAERAIRRFVRRLDPSKRIRMRERVRLQVGTRLLVVTVDEIEDTGSQRILKLYRFSPPPKNHPPRDYRYALYSAAHLQDSPDAVHEVRLVYPLHDLDLPAPPGRGVIKSHPKKMEELIGHIESGQFTPKPSYKICSTCPFNLICPA
jgi:DNA helicase-2/ATP-dependent DNA helicase PcrA